MAPSLPPPAPPRHSRVTWPWWKIVLYVILALFFVTLGQFCWMVYRNVVAIKSGQINPLLDRQMESSLSRLRANQTVTAADIASLMNANAPSKGNKNGKLTIVEFVDYSCPYTRSSAGAVRELAERYKSQVQLIVRNFPLEDIHPRARAAAIAARCANLQGKFWEYHDKLLSGSENFEDADFVRYAKEVGIDTATFSACTDEERTLPSVMQDMTDGLRVGVEGTPAFFFNGTKIQGEVDIPTLDYLIKTFLR